MLLRRFRQFALIKKTSHINYLPCTSYHVDVLFADPIEPIPTRFERVKILLHKWHQTWVVGLIRHTSSGPGPVLGTVPTLLQCRHILMAFFAQLLHQQLHHIFESIQILCPNWSSLGPHRSTNGRDFGLQHLTRGGLLSLPGSVEEMS